MDLSFAFVGFPLKPHNEYGFSIYIISLWYTGICQYVRIDTERVRTYCYVWFIAFPKLGPTVKGRWGAGICRKGNISSIQHNNTPSQTEHKSNDHNTMPVLIKRVWAQTLSVPGVVWKDRTGTIGGWLSCPSKGLKASFFALKCGCWVGFACSLRSESNPVHSWPQLRETDDTMQRTSQPAYTLLHHLCRSCS